MCNFLQITAEVIIPLTGMDGLPEEILEMVLEYVSSPPKPNLRFVFLLANALPKPFPNGLSPGAELSWSVGVGLLVFSKLISASAFAGLSGRLSNCSRSCPLADSKASSAQ